MSENKDSDLEQKFSTWVEEKTKQNNHQVNDEQFVDEKLWQERATTANYVAHQADVSEEHDVPKWDRSSTFETDIQPWWQWRALPAMSFAFSCFAIALVLLKVELVIKPEGMMLSFAGNQQAIEDSRVAELVDQKLQAFSNEQQLVLDNYATDIQVKQQDSNLQLASYVMGASRQERKEDMTDFIKYINEQREDQQFDQNMKFKQLENAIQYRNTRLNNNLENIGLQAQPENWTTEE
jgi:hypothetical protein